MIKYKVIRSITHLIQLARGSSGYQKNLLTRGGVPKDPDHRRHAQEEEGSMAPTLSPFV